MSSTNAPTNTVAATAAPNASNPVPASNGGRGAIGTPGVREIQPAQQRGMATSNFLDNARLALAGASEVEWKQALDHGVSSRRIDRATADRFLAEGGFRTGAPATTGRAASDQKISEPAIGGEALLARDTTNIPEASLRQIAKDGVAWGRWDQATADKMLTEAGLTPEPRDDRNADEIALAELTAPAKPEDFKIPVRETYSPTPLTPEEIHYTSTSQAWLAEAGFTKELGNAFAATVAEQSKRISKMDDAGRASFIKKSFEELKSTYGEKFDSTAADVRALLDQVEKARPGLKAMLKATGIADSAGVFKALANQVARNKLRNG